MSQAAIPFSFESYLQAKLTAGEVVNMNRIVLANIPDLDHTIPIDRNETLPDESQIVYEQDVDQVGKVNSNAVVYSIVMDTSVGDFDFNAMYLIDKDQRTAIGMIVHKETETKTATDETSGVQGNSLVKSMLVQFDGAAAATNITVDAETWQIDYSVRLKGMDEDVRIQALDIFGHDAFIADGFKTTQSAGNQYFVESGEAYIGGLKAVLDGDVTLTVSNLPSFIYAVVNRQGTALSAFANTVELQVSQDELSDYVANGVNYYVAKIATVNADGTVTDERTTSLNEQQFASLQQQIDDVNADLQGHKGANDPHSQYLLTNKFLRAMLGKPVHESIVGRTQDDDLIAAAVGQKLYVADYQTAYEIISQANNFIDETTKAADPFQYAGYWGFGNDGADFFTTPNLSLTMHIKSAGSYGNAGETKEAHTEDHAHVTGFAADSSGGDQSIGRLPEKLLLNDGDMLNNFVSMTLPADDERKILVSGNGTTNGITVQHVSEEIEEVTITGSHLRKNVFSTVVNDFTDSMGTFFDPYIWLPKGEF